jgi:hypothetical protein
MKLTRERLSESGEQVRGVGKHAGSALCAKSVKGSQELFNFFKKRLRKARTYAVEVESVVLWLAVALAKAAQVVE